MCTPLPVRGRVLTKLRPALEGHAVSVRHTSLTVFQLALQAAKVRNVREGRRRSTSIRRGTPADVSGQVLAALSKCRGVDGRGGLVPH